MKPLLIASAVLLALGIITAIGCATSRSSYESASYESIEQENAFELRRYPELTLASTDTKTANSSFNRLFKYISGENETESKIAMTTPVFMKDGAMSFVLPAEVADGAAPKPTGSGVRLDAFPGGLHASLRFSGNQNAAGEAKARESLSAELKTRGLQPGGEIFFAYYDPPWTPPFLRRNEALVLVSE